MASNLKAAVAAIEKRGVLLVYPINNRPEPPSLWSEFYPRSRMRWEWDDEGDDRVAKLWHLRSQLSASGKVVYSKWYQGRATFFSREIFTAMLAVLGTSRHPERDLGPEARLIYELLSSDSPLSTKQIRRSTELVGRALEPAYARAIKELFNRMLIVGFGEVDDGAFPSLAQGSTRLLFEPLWEESRALSREDALAILHAKLEPASLFLKYFARLRKSCHAPGAAV